jgi:hypothetical protein
MSTTSLKRKQRPQRSKQREKSAGAHIFKSERGILFVPSEQMWTVQILASQGQASIEELAEAAGISFALIYYWLRKFKCLAWFRPWLLENAPAPNGVRVATLEQVRHCCKTWDYLAHSGQAELYGADAFAR